MVWSVRSVDQFTVLSKTIIDPLNYQPEHIDSVVMQVENVTKVVSITSEEVVCQVSAPSVVEDTMPIVTESALYETFPSPVKATEPEQEQPITPAVVHTKTWKPAQPLSPITNLTRSTPKRPFAMALLLSVVVTVLGAIALFVPYHQWSTRKTPQSVQPPLYIRAPVVGSQMVVPVQNFIVQEESSFDMGVLVVQTLVVQSLVVQPVLLAMAFAPKLLITAPTATYPLLLAPPSASYPASNAHFTPFSSDNLGLLENFITSAPLTATVFDTTIDMKLASVMQSFEIENLSPELLSRTADLTSRKVLFLPVPPAKHTQKRNWASQIRNAARGMGGAVRAGARFIIEVFEHQHGAYV